LCIVAFRKDLEDCQNTVQVFYQRIHGSERTTSVPLSFILTTKFRSQVSTDSVLLEFRRHSTSLTTCIRCHGMYTSNTCNRWWMHSGGSGLSWKRTITSTLFCKLSNDEASEDQTLCFGWDSLAIVHYVGATSGLFQRPNRLHRSRKCLGAL